MHPLLSDIGAGDCTFEKVISTQFTGCERVESVFKCRFNIDFLTSEILLDGACIRFDVMVLLAICHNCQIVKQTLRY